MNNALHLQNQVRNNASDIKNYIKELYDWEEQVNNSNAPQPAQNQTDLPIRGKVEIDLHKQKSIKELKRDANNIKEYYSAWNKFDVDKELETVDEIVPKSQPSARIAIKGGNQQQGQKKQQIADNLLSLKDEANQKFKQGSYNEAISLYQECQDQLDQQTSLNKDEQELIVILHSNKAQCLIYQSEYLQAIKECDHALSINNYHLKSLSRKATCLKHLGKWKDAIKEYRVAVTIDNSLEKELKQLEQKLLNQKKNAKEKLIKKNIDYKKLKELSVINVIDVKEGKKEEDVDQQVQEQLEKKRENKKIEEEIPEKERKIRFGEVKYEKEVKVDAQKPKLQKRGSLKHVLKYKGDDSQEKVNYKCSFDYKTLNEKNIDGKVIKKEE